MAEVQAKKQSRGRQWMQARREKGTLWLDNLLRDGLDGGCWGYVCLRTSAHGDGREDEEGG
jgi:hypothetical protein